MSSAAGVWLVVGVAGLAWIGLAARSARRQTVGCLRFVGARGTDCGWRWSISEFDEGFVLDSVEAAVDFQSRILARLHGPACVPAWVWLERTRAPADWLALRRAIAADRRI